MALHIAAMFFFTHQSYKTQQTFADKSIVVLQRLFEGVHKNGAFIALRFAETFSGGATFDI